MRAIGAWPQPKRGECMAKLADDDWCVVATVAVHANGMSYTYCAKHAEQWRAAQ